MLRAAGARLAVLTAVFAFLGLATSVYAEAICSINRLLSNATVDNKGRFLLVPIHCSLLDSSKKPVKVDSSLALQGDPSGDGSINTDFLTDAIVLAPGATLILANLRLINVRFGQGSFLSLSAFDTSQLLLSSVTIVTDCESLSSLSGASLPGLVQGPAYIYVANYTARGVQATAVNITCDLPAVSVDGSVVALGDSLELYNILAGYATNNPASLNISQSITGPLTVTASQNINLSSAVWKCSSPLLITRNVTLRGAPNMHTILDLQAIYSAIYLTRGVVFAVEDFTIVNAGPLRKSLEQQSIAPSFSIPMWLFEFERSSTSPQLILTNCTLLLTPSEYQFFTLWTMLATTEVLSSDVGASIRASTITINFTSSTNETMRFSRLTGSGVDMVNVTLTNIVRAMVDPSLVLNNPVLMQSFGAVPDMKVVPVYDLSDMMAILNIMQVTPSAVGIAMCVLGNITIDSRVWPDGGYQLKQPLLLVGQNNAGQPTWIDFQRVQNFVSVQGCAPLDYMYVQGIHFINIPNGLLQPEGTALAGSVAEAMAASGVVDVSIYLTNFQGVADARCHSSTPSLFLNQSTLLITYAEFRQVHNTVMRSVGVSTRGNGTAIGSSFTYDLSSVVVDHIDFLNIFGWGWSGYKINMTYMCPSDVPLFYSNVFEPLGGSAPPAPPPVGDIDLRPWQIALIVVGAILLVALLASLVAWRISVRRLRHEVEAVKSGNMDKKSSNASAEQNIPSAGCRVGSSATGGNAVNGNGDLEKNGLKGIGGGAGGGAISDDSTGALQHDKPPLEVLNNMMATLAQEMGDQHLNILEVIGQGGFGVVYRGMWKGLNVAVKTITFQDRVAGGEKAQHRAILEAAISSSLAYPNVVTTYSYDVKPLTVQNAVDSPSSGNGHCDGGGGGGLIILDKRTVLDWKLYLVQEYCDGGSLRTAILKRKFFDMNKGEPRMEMILDTCIELTGGLMHLHERSIIHGDLNPNNVLLKRDASKKYGAICKIADFGLSIRMNADQSHISNMRRGTPFYTCPQILACGNMTKASDVYSMGIMMWEIYHCCMSYRSLPSGFVARENFPRFPRKAPHAFAQVVGSCLAAEPSRRPTFAQLRSELEAQLQALKRGEMRSGEDVLGPDPAGDAAHLAACQD